MSRLIRAVSLVLVLSSACGPSLPEIDTLPSGPGGDQLAGCRIQPDQTRPMMVEWPATDKAALDAETADRVAVVEYDGCRLRLLPACGVPTTYEFRPTAPTEDSFRVENQTDLYARLPLGAASLETEIERGSKLQVNYVIVGQRRAGLEDVALSSLASRAECQGATHWVRAIIVGAYKIDVFRSARVRGRGGVGSAGAGVETGGEAELLRRGGNFAGCQSGDLEPSSTSCQALVQLDLASIAGAAPPPTGPTAVVPPVEGPVAPQVDSDGDGYADATDQCPYEPEDFDGQADTDGCPDADYETPSPPPTPAAEQGPCYPGQVWVDDMCRGVPECPSGMRAEGESCICKNGKELMHDGRTCCWPGQALVGGICRGVPSYCPDEHELRGEECAYTPSEETLARERVIQFIPDTFTAAFAGIFGMAVPGSETSWNVVRFANHMEFGFAELGVSLGVQWGEAGDWTYAGLGPGLAAGLVPLAILPPEHNPVGFTLAVGGNVFMATTMSSDCSDGVAEDCGEEPPGITAPLGVYGAVNAYLGCSFGLKLAYEHRLTDDTFYPSNFWLGAFIPIGRDAPGCD